MERTCTIQDDSMEQTQPPDSSIPAVAVPDWATLVKNIQTGHATAVEELYSVFGRGIRFFLLRQLGPQDLDDRVHDAFLVVIQAIQNGELREPERLMGFVRTIVRRQTATHINEAIVNRREHVAIDQGPVLTDRARTPEERAMSEQRAEFMREVLQSMSQKDREVLTRFYLNEQSQEQICAEMELTDTQFRLLKSRAKARFGEVGRRKLEKRSPQKSFMRDLGGIFH
jgi:RNA polymerase sigma-70 factor (ECF subfamily)